MPNCRCLIVFAVLGLDPFLAGDRNRGGDEQFRGNPDPDDGERELAPSAEAITEFLVLASRIGLSWSPYIMS